MIPHATLRSKWALFKSRLTDGNLLAATLIWIDGEHRGGHNAGLNDENQRRLDAAIDMVAKEGGVILDRDIQQRALELRTLQHNNTRSRSNRFIGSRGFVWNFKRKFHLDNRRPRIFSKPIVIDPVVDRIFLDTSQRWARRVPPRLFIQLDETSWKLVNPPLSTVVPHGVRARVDGGADIRSCFTMVLIVAASGKKLKPVFVKRGKTEVSVRSLKQLYGDKAYFQFAEKGFSKEQTIIDIIKNVIYPYTRGQQAVLMMDVYNAHTTPRVLTALRLHNIVPIWVPAGATSIRQPLDVGVMGVLKMRARTLWHKQRSGFTCFGRLPITMSRSVGHAISAYGAISPSIIRRAFRVTLSIIAWPTKQQHAIRHVIGVRRFPRNHMVMSSIEYVDGIMKRFTLTRHPIFYHHIVYPPQRKRYVKKAKVAERSV
jgi:hypothetical protein